ncbi:protein FAR1-RELATED SEQUENCE 5-like [Humulus lupulus]|uniref:protein FAR1-RELATED SEQUENCE 5-like n=1 Tax=Humulus lupulus TaxID=3486 RepID=UPI002B40B236|nr:protein FAR1-RELATED SEQUENCE 5-like [Humulus lupulus]
MECHNLEEYRSCRKLDFESTKNIEAKEKIEIIHSKILDEEIPKIDMEFGSEEEAYNFYNSYAFKVGFSIRRSKGQKDQDGRMIDRMFCYSCEGYRRRDRRDMNVKYHRAETRFGCLARMKVTSRQTDNYRVIEFVAEHTHVTSSPNKSHLHRSHRRVTAAQAAEIDMADRSRIAPKESCELMARRAGGRENLGMIPLDYKNYLRTKRMIQMRLGETGGVLEYLQRMQSKDPNFFYAIQVDVDDLITNIFWADAAMITSYFHFGDVISFDTTYRKNQEGRPFAMFLGVNNHKQTTVFGTALLYDETAETFMWLFDTFATAMSGKKPKTILTDQDAAMAKALSSQWPETYHRLCIWHIYQNAAKHLNNVFEKFREFSKEFSNCIYDYDEESEFVEAWNNMLIKYDLEGNDWLKQMYDLREKRALVYGRETFCADMTTTQRSESMNNAIKGFVSYKHNLLRFFENFERLLDYRRYEELQADFKATQRKVKLSFEVEILKHASSFYTPAVLNMFQTQVCESYDCVITLFDENETLFKYKIFPKKMHLHHIVEYDSADDTVTCSCKKFQFTGILCSHALKVLSEKNILKIPSRYILKRWTIKAKVRDELDNCAANDHSEDPKIAMVNRYQELCRLFQTCVVTKASKSEKAYNYAKSGLRKIVEEIDDPSNDQIIHSYDENQYSSREMNNIKGIKTKGKVRGKSSRPKGALEKARKKKKVERNKNEESSGSGKKFNQNTFDGPYQHDPFIFGASQSLKSGILSINAAIFKNWVSSLFGRDRQLHFEVPLAQQPLQNSELCISPLNLNQHESQNAYTNLNNNMSMMELLQQTHSFHTSFELPQNPSNS